MFKRNLILIFLCLTVISCSGKEDLTELFQKDIMIYLDAYNKTDWEKVTSMIYPPFFKAVSKYQIIETLKTLDSMGMKRTFTLKGIEKISDVIINGEEKFCLVNYNTQIIIVINKLQLANIEKFKEDFEEDFGKENVEYDDKLNQFTISARQKIIAASNKDSDNWKYIELNNEHAIDRVLLIISEDILKRLEK